MTTRDAQDAHALAPPRWPGLAETVELAIGSYRTLAMRFDAFLLLAAPWIVVVDAVNVLLDITRLAKGLLVLALVIIGGSSVAAGWHRMLLLGEPWREAMRPRGAIWKIAILALLAWVYALIPTAIVEAVTGVGSIFLFLLLFLFFIAAWLRAFPTLAIDPRMTVRQSLRHLTTPGPQIGKAFAGTVVAGLPVALIELNLPGGLVTAAASRILMGALDIALLLAVPALIAGFSSALHRRLEARPTP
jgi:hypothetical protein